MLFVGFVWSVWLCSRECFIPDVRLGERRCLLGHLSRSAGCGESVPCISLGFHCQRSGGFGIGLRSDQLYCLSCHFCCRFQFSGGFPVVL